MYLPRSVRLRVQYVLEHTEDLRCGRLQADPRWLQCIEDTLRTCHKEKLDFFEAYFIKKLTCDEVLFDLYIERSTLYAWREEIFVGVALRAAAAGLIRVVE